LVVAVLLASTAWADAELEAMRAAKRALVRSAVAAKAEGGAPFGLLVIPVDFADARFTSGQPPLSTLDDRLGDDSPGDLGHYFLAASRGHSTLDVQLSDVVHLPGDRQDYSDIDLQGAERSRLMATQALEGAAAQGADFAMSDHLGDGEVDGVLILHAGIGLENDPDGLIVPLQYFLEEPVVSRGTLARTYAVAAAGSQLGAWAHETAHLFGLADRYDLHLPSSGEAEPRGGLGRFSLMAAGWVGEGDGTNPSLPDAYSSLELGWIQRSLGLVADGVACVLPMAESVPNEYFLAELRAPDPDTGYDAALPGQRLIVYHVDTSLAEGEASSSSIMERHLRVRLVEADGEDQVALGESVGTDADLFPSDGVTQDLSDATWPWSRSYLGVPSGTSISVNVDGDILEFLNHADTHRRDFRLEFVDDGGLVMVRPRLAWQGLEAPETVALTLICESTRWGEFSSGSVLNTTMARVQSSGWDMYSIAQEEWQPAADLEPGARTTFSYSLDGGSLGSGSMVWIWDRQEIDLDIDGDWPGNWEVDAQDSDTTWHRWPMPGQTLGGYDQETVLIATGTSHTSATDWPDVSYSNNGHAVLLSPLQGADVRWIELLHAEDLELLHQGLAVDGVGLSWVHANGTQVPADVLDGWTGEVESRSRHALAGQPTFAEQFFEAYDVQPFWHRDILVLPSPAEFGPGPWRLRLELASNEVWRARGWLVSDITGHLDEPPVSSFPIEVADGDLTWSYGLPGDYLEYVILGSEDGGELWQVLASMDHDAEVGIQQSISLSDLALKSGTRTWLRVVAGEARGLITSRAVETTPSSSVILGRPRPNPAGPLTRVTVDSAGDESAELGLFDLQGKLVRFWQPGPQRTDIIWDGTDGSDRRLAAGVYIFRLRANGRILTRKVTWLH